MRARKSSVSNPPTSRITPGITPPPDASSEPLLVTSAIAARCLRISERTLATLKKHGIIPAIKLRGSVRYHMPSVRAALLKLERLETVDGVDGDAPQKERV
jgi:hypothetical protein